MKKTLNLGWLYPDLMGIYGDRGNIIALTKRCEWRGITVILKPVTLDSALSELRSADILMMGGAQDRQQTIVAKDLEKKKSILQEKIENGTPGLFICGGFQFLGKYYKESDGTVIRQLGVLDVYTENPGGKRLIGNIAVDASDFFGDKTVLIGFENHGGRTKLGKEVKPLGKVLKGFGSNAEDGQEGAVYKNSIGTYLHGPILPKNPVLTDWLIQKALEKKYKEPITLAPLDDTLALKAHDKMLQTLHSS
jgi:CobQ-like glutamine amidotransferase family enzyme